MTRETVSKPASGGLMVVLLFALLALSVALVIGGGSSGSPPIIVAGVLGILLTVLLVNGFLVVQPNQAAALIFFGKYVGSVKTNGFFWVNPFMVKKKVSLRARNLNGERLKVNDRAGNPIEIAAVVVWQVQNTAQCLFDVDDYVEYVKTQSESAVRHLATSYPYDSADAEGEHSLRGDIEVVSGQLERELAERLSRAGVDVLEARLSHLAYAPEIAGAMLQRQQADAIIAARAKIVDGAVGMVEDALNHLGQRQIVELDDERKAQMVMNLLVVLCGHADAQPVLNAGSMY
ncbi:MAG: SPFH domain-containing protein [Gemmatimonadetes bacterium]|nr:SPFH domain-containing protein [Gemmatimonadota bacterium]